MAFDFLSKINKKGNKAPKKEVGDASENEEFQGGAMDGEGFGDETGIMEEGASASAKEAPKKAKSGGSDKKKLLIPISIAAAVLIGTGAVWFMQNSGDGVDYDEQLAQDFAVNKATNEQRVGTRTDKTVQYDETTKQLKEKQISSVDDYLKDDAPKADAPKIAEKPKSEDGVEKNIKVVQSNDQKIITMDDIKAIEIQGNQAKKQIAESLSIGGDGNMDPFLMQYESVINNKKKWAVLQSTTELYDGAAKFLEAKLKYDKANELYRQKLEQAANEESFGDMKKTVSRDFNSLRQEVYNLKNETESLKSELEKARAEEKERGNKMPNAVPSGETEQTGEFVGESNGLIFTGGSGVILSPTYNGVFTTQTIYRIGDGFILEESDMNGNLKSYKVGQKYRGGLITNMTADIISLKFGNQIYLVTVAQGGGASQNGYNYVSISKPTSSTIKNAKNMQGRDKNVGPQDYGQVMLERQNIANDARAREEAQIFRR
jgi:hypothetical protein